MWSGPLALAAVSDEVTVRTSPQTVRRVTGTIIEYNADELTIQRPTGREESFPSVKIEHFATTWPAEYVTAKQKMAAGDFRGAIPELRAAVAEEGRRWAQRQMIADTVRCYFEVGDLQRAGATYQVIYGDSKINRHLAVLPIQWWSGQPPLEDLPVLQQWLQADPPLRLLAASRLFSTTAHRSKAKQTLHELVLESDPRVATLASCQLWREQVATASLETVEQWRDQIESLAPELRTGPSLVIASTLSRLGRRDDATLLLLRCPILYGQQSELAAQSLLAAAALRQRAERPRQAAELYREILDRFPNTTAAPQARELLKTNP